MIGILWAVFKYCLLIVIVGIIIAITVAALCAIAAIIKLAIGAVISFFREVYSVFGYKGKRWQRKQKAIMRRDGYMCQWCKRYGRNVQATVVHHIEHADTHPELGYTDSNLISLCAACHNKAHPEKANKARRCR